MGGHIDFSYLQVVRRKTKDGFKEYVYFRAKGIPRERMYPEAPDFLKRYNELRASAEGKDPPAQTVEPMSIAWLIDRYQESDDWKRLAPASQKAYRIHLALLESRVGHLPFAEMRRPFFKALRSEFSETPGKANSLARITSALYAWAIDEDYETQNPAAGLKMYREGDGHMPWEESEIKAYRAKWAPETLQRAVMETLLGSLLRQCDAVRLQRPNIVDGHVRIRQKKTNEWVRIPLLDDSLSALEPYLASHKHMSLLVTPAGKPLTTNQTYEAIKSGLKKVKLSHLSAHGLRVTGAVRLYEIGVPIEQIKPFTGHRTAENAKLYATRKREMALNVSNLNTALKRTKD